MRTPAPFVYSCPYSWTATLTSPRNIGDNRANRPRMYPRMQPRIHECIHECNHEFTNVSTNATTNDHECIHEFTKRPRMHTPAPFVYSCPYSWTATLTSPRINFGSSASRSAASVRDCSSLTFILAIMDLANSPNFLANSTGGTEIR
jgi:hypothetical protein